MAVTKWSISGSEKSVPAKDQQSKRLRCAAAVALTRASALSRASATFFCETRLIARDYHLTLLQPMLGIARWGRGSLQPPSDRANAHSLQPSVVYGSALCYFVLKTECYFVLKTDVSAEELTFGRWILDYRSKKVTRRVWGGGTHYAQELRARYDYDFFVSYASVDNVPVPAADRGCVATLINILTSGSGLAGKLGRRELFNWWID